MPEWLAPILITQGLGVGIMLLVAWGNSREQKGKNKAHRDFIDSKMTGLETQITRNVEASEKRDEFILENCKNCFRYISELQREDAVIKGDIGVLRETVKGNYDVLEQRIAQVEVR